MFKHPGKTLQFIAKAVFCLLLIACIVLGIVLIVFAFASKTEIGIILGILVMIFGPLVVYLPCLLLYGFGTIVRKCENGGDEPAHEEEDDPDFMPRRRRTFSEWIGLEEDDEEEEENDGFQSVSKADDQKRLDDVNCCKRCHRPIPRDSHFCTNCGAKQ